MEMRAADNAADGMADEDARLDAIRRFGNNTQIQEHTRAQHLIVWLETVVQDVRYGLRTLRRSPVFTIVAIATMVLSIGATTAIFTVVESILLRPLPYPDAGQLITIATFMPKQNSEVTASPEYMGWRDHSSTLAGVAAYDVENVNFSGAGDPDRVVAAYTTANFLSVLGISPRLGRMFSSDEDQPGSAHVVVLSHALWQSRFGMAADTIGKKIMLEGELYTILGILPENFRFPDATLQPDILVPLGLPNVAPSEKQPMAIINAVGRLKPGVTLAQAGADLSSVSQQLIASYSGGIRTFLSGSSVHVRSLQTELVGNVQRGLLVVLAAVGLVTLIGCLNVASLQLARAVQRGPEVGIRSALGAGKQRLVRQLLTENLVLSFAGGCGGLTLAVVSVRFLRAARLRAFPITADIHMDARVLVGHIHGHDFERILFRTCTGAVGHAFRSRARANLQHANSGRKPAAPFAQHDGSVGAFRCIDVAGRGGLACPQLYPSHVNRSRFQSAWCSYSPGELITVQLSEARTATGLY